MIHHPFGIAGLSLNTLGALLLIWYPPGMTQFTMDGAVTMKPWPTDPKQWHIFGRKIIGAYTALGCLALGFVLQLIDLLTA